MATTFGYVRTSRARQDGQAGMDPETQQQQLRAAGVSPANLYVDAGVSGTAGAATRRGWRVLDKRMVEGDVLVVAAVDRIGRRWLDTASVLRDLRSRGIRLRSLAQAEQVWTRYLDADPDSPEALIGDILAAVFSWQAEQEQRNISRRTRAGLARARAQGKTLGRPSAMTPEQVETALRLFRDGWSKTKIAAAIGVSRGTVQNRLRGIPGPRPLQRNGEGQL